MQAVAGISGGRTSARMAFLLDPAPLTFAKGDRVVARNGRKATYPGLVALVYVPHDLVSEDLHPYRQPAPRSQQRVAVRFADGEVVSYHPDDLDLAPRCRARDLKGSTLAPCTFDALHEGRHSFQSGASPSWMQIWGNDVARAQAAQVQDVYLAARRLGVLALAWAEEHELTDADVQADIVLLRAHFADRGGRE